MGNLIVLSAPSGTGKTTTLKKLLEKNPDLKYSVSYTTRGVRGCEVDGVDYNFVSESEFNDMIKKGDFIEYANVHGNYYGTSRKLIEDMLNSGHNVVLDIDTKGAKILKSIFTNSILIFLVTHTYEDLESRLRNRSTDSDLSIEKRLTNAKKEVQEFALYNYVIYNDDIDKTVSMIECIIKCSSQSSSRFLSYKDIIK